MSAAMSRPLLSSASSSSEEIDSMSTLVLTLIGSNDWSQNSGLIHRAKKDSKALQSGGGGQWFICNERYGGNTLNREWTESVLV